MPKIRRIDFSPDEWIAGIAGMLPEDQGIYWLICSLIYSSGGPIQSDDPRLKSLCGCHGNKLNAILVRLENSGKILRNGPEIDQKRCRNELEKAQKRSRNALENGQKGGRKLSETNTETSDNNDIVEPAGFSPPNPSRTRTINYQLSTINHQLKESPLTPPRGGRAPEGFDEWYEGWPHKVGKAAAIRAFAKAIKLATLAELIAATQRYVRDKPPDQRWCNPATWLNEHRWLDMPANGAVPNGHDVSERVGPREPPPAVPPGWEERIAAIKLDGQ